MTRALPRLLLAVLLLTAGAARAAAQEVRVGGGDRSRAMQVAREVLARGQYLRLDRDTTLPAGFRAPGDLVVYDAEVRLEGVVDGTVVVVGGHFYVRPGARVGGPIAVVGGGAYPSALATTGEVLEAEPGTRLVLEGDSVAVRDAGTLQARVVPPPRPSLFSFGPRPLPSYDRVNGVTLALGVTFRPTRVENGLTIDAWGTYRVERESPGGGIRVDAPIAPQNVRLRVEASRATRTNDAWIRGDLSNTVSAVLWARDYRDYWDADQLSLTLHRPIGKPLIAGESWLNPRLVLLVSRDRPLRERDPWSLFGERDDPEGLARFNQPVLEGTVASAAVGAQLTWRAATSTLFLDGSVEQGLAAVGDFGFTHAMVSGRYDAVALYRHQLTVNFRGMAPLDGDGSPPQRWGILGGPGTIPTRDIGDFRGDHLAWVESTYGVPLRSVEIPFLGMPTVELSHIAGMAWVTGQGMPPWVQNVGVGARFALVRGRVLMDPADRRLKPVFEFGFSIPRR